MTDILTAIIENKRQEVAKAKARKNLSLVKALAEAADPPRSFLEALKARETAPRVIAECKRMSPSAGIFRPSFDPVEIAVSYERAGAAAISVLTDEKFFGGRLEDLTAVQTAVNIPVLRKDFTVDEYQIYEARAAGADSILLIAGVLDLAQLQYFIEISRELDMEPLVESHSEAELKIALKTDGRIIGINSRNLKSFGVDLDQLGDLGKKTRAKHPERLLVAESGIKTANDIEQMTSMGYKAFLIGESLLRQPDCGAALLQLLGKQ